MSLAIALQTPYYTHIDCLWNYLLNHDTQLSAQESRSLACQRLLAPLVLISMVPHMTCMYASAHGALRPQCLLWQVGDLRLYFPCRMRGRKNGDKAGLKSFPSLPQCGKLGVSDKSPEKWSRNKRGNRVETVPPMGSLLLKVAAMPGGDVATCFMCVTESPSGCTLLPIWEVEVSKK